LGCDQLLVAVLELILGRLLGDDLVTNGVHGREAWQRPWPKGCGDAFEFRF
jgi:hypothetical protein